MKNKVILLFLTMIWYGQIYAQNNSISGTVRDASDAPLPGVSIIISGTSQGTVTDIDGKYSLSAPPNATLIFLTSVIKPKPSKSKTEAKLM